MRHPALRLSALALLLASQGGCADIIYQPAASPRIQIRGDGAPMKDGEVVTSLEDAVRGNPIAEDETRLAARDARTGNILNIVGSVGGLGTGVGTTILFAGTQKSASPVAAGLLIGGGIASLGLSIAGTMFSGKSTKHRLNAINLYNDGLPPAPPPPAANTQ
jgi:hypothetical protein